MTTRKELLRALQPVLTFLSGKRFTTELQDELLERFPRESAYLQHLKLNVARQQMGKFLPPPRKSKENYSLPRFGNAQINPIQLETIDVKIVGYTRTAGPEDSALSVTKQANSIVGEIRKNRAVHEKISWYIPTATDGTAAILCVLPAGTSQRRPKA